MYKLMVSIFDKTITSIFNSELNNHIPLDIGNKDYQQFKTDISNGVELQDPDGNKMTKAKVTAFLKTLP